MMIKESKEKDLAAILKVHRAAFGQEDEAQLVEAILRNCHASQYVSLAAWNSDKLIGHILFSQAAVEDVPEYSKNAILAPLSVLPEFQNQGIGGKLIQKGLEILSERGFDLVFVLGNPGYYPRFGFEEALCFGLKAPYPIAPEHSRSWMVQPLQSIEVLNAVTGKIICCEPLMKAELWQ